VLQDGTLRCWGLNSHGQIGTDAAPVVYEPSVVAGVTAAVSVSCGGNHTCARLQDGTVRCWGANADGELGNNTNVNSSIPVAVAGISTATAVSAGARHTCAVLTDGTTRCWGRNYFGQLGNGTTVDSPVPVSVTTAASAKEIVCGYGHTCALLQNGGVQCWGLGDGGQLGSSGSTTANPNPLTPFLFSSPKAVAIGAERKASTALFEDGTAAYWGANGSLSQRTPYTMWKQNDGTALTSASDHTCVCLADGSLQCWGYNSFLQIASGPPNDIYQFPTAVSGLGPVQSASTGLYHSCALLQNGSVQCWGYNFYGQLGQSGIASSGAPLTVTGF
jgi:hypothetical protein